MRRPTTALASVLLAIAAGTSLAASEADEILALAGVKGGLVVHLGCGDGRLTAALRASDAFVVQGLTTDQRDLAAARERVRKLGLYGPVTIAAFDGKHLPYADNIVNLLVAESLGGVASEEAMRVLAPGGTLCTRRNGRWATTVKPRPGNTDDWTHFLHDPSGNAVSRDIVVGPPRRVQWLADPPHTRSHEHTPSIEAVVSAGGRIFYLADEGPIWSLRKPAQWRLVARDAYNGILLWKRDVPVWFPHIVNWGAFPRQLQRRLVATPDRLYATLGYFAPVSAIEASTGKTTHTYEGTEGADEIVLHDGILLVVVRAVTEERKRELTNWLSLEKKDNSPLYVREKAQPLLNRFRSTYWKAPTAVLAVEAASGRILWKKNGPEAARVRPLTLCAEGDRVFYQSAGKTHCLDLRTGRLLWTASSPPTRLVCGGKVVCVGGATVAMLSAADGKALWQTKSPLDSIRDAFLINGSLWLGGFPPYQKKVGRKIRSSAWGPFYAVKLDLENGKVLERIEAENPSHHHRCWQNKATVRYILAGRRGVEFYDLAARKVLWHNWVRGVCRYGIMPANGLLYAPPHACGCYITAKLDGFFALAPDQPKPVPPEDRLERGPAYTAPPASPPDASASWPTYRHDPQRSGATDAAVRPPLREKWRTTVGGRLTAPTVADGKVFVASVDDHRVVALDAATGKSLWTFTAGGRVDSPPTFHRGLVLFGANDGCLYCLRASDGALAWRLHTPGSDRRIVARGQIESPRPLRGSVLVKDGVAWCIAGRSTYLDGGMTLYRIEPTTGRVLSRTRLYSPDPKTGEQPKQYGPAAMPGQLSDILVADAQRVYLREAAFARDGRRTKQVAPHLLTLTGFLDDTWPHRSYWIFGTRCSLSIGCAGRAHNLVYGRLLTHGGRTVYGYGRRGVHWSNQLQDGPYRLFAIEFGERSPKWESRLPATARALVVAGDLLYVAGPLGRDPALVIAISASDGKERWRANLPAEPVFDGMAATPVRLYVALETGAVACLKGSGR